MTAWCSNAAESLAVMNRVDSAGTFTATDHVKVLDAALTQVPVPYLRQVWVSTDTVGASREFIDHLHTLNTARTHAPGGRRVEYSIGWPVQARTRTRTAIENVPD